MQYQLMIPNSTPFRCWSSIMIPTCYSSVELLITPDPHTRRRRPQPPTSRPSSGTSRGEPRDQPQESEWPPLPRPGQYRDWSHFPRSSRYEDRPVWPTYHSDHPGYYGQHGGARGDPSAGYPERWNTYPGQSHCERCYCC